MDFYLLFKIAFLLLFLDFLWINFFLIEHFSNMIQNIQNSPLKVKSDGAIVAYIILILFAYNFIPKTASVSEAFLLGFLTYAVYDSTNYATLDKYDAQVAIMDSIWGGILFALIKFFIS